MRTPLIPALVLLVSASLVALTGCTIAAGPDAEPSTSTSTSPSTSATPRASADPTAAQDEAMAGAEQTVAESCAIANQAVFAAQGEVSGVFSGLAAGDYAGVAAALTSIEGQLGAAAQAITNPEVGTPLSDLVATFAVANEQVAAGAGGATVDLQALQATAAQIQAGAQRMEALCT